MWLKKFRNFLKLDKEYDSKRVEANKEIIKILSIYLEKNPQIRFNQALVNLGMYDSQGNSYYQEPWDTLEDLRYTLAYKEIEKFLGDKNEKS